MPAPMFAMLHGAKSNPERTTDMISRWALAAAAFGKAVTDHHAQARASLDGLKAEFKPVGDACDDCHKDYRLSQR